MMKLRLAFLFGLLVVLCVSFTPTTAEDPKSEPEPEAEAEPGAHDPDSKHAGATVGKQTKAAAGGNSPASAPWAFSVPAIFAFVCVAKFIL